MGTFRYRELGLCGADTAFWLLAAVHLGACRGQWRILSAFNALVHKAISSTLNPQIHLRMVEGKRHSQSKGFLFVRQWNTEIQTFNALKGLRHTENVNLFFSWQSNKLFFSGGIPWKAWASRGIQLIQRHLPGKERKVSVEIKLSQETRKWRKGGGQMKGKNRGIGNTEIRNEGKANVTS